MTANDSKSCLDCLNKLADEEYNSHHRSIGGKVIHANYFALSEEFKSCHKAPKFKYSDRVGVRKYKITLKRLH